MRQTANRQQKYYFSEKLKNQLDQISRYPLTVIEAPSGFGKTTAVREYLRAKHPQAVCEWYICLGESVSSAWAEICGLFAVINNKVADEIKNLKIPTMDTLRCMKEYLKNLKCRRETYLVIDNYHLINFDLHGQLISALSMHEDPNLHMILITQQLDSSQTPVHNSYIHMADTSSFFFDREGIASLFRMEGIRLAEEELESVFRRTEGWVSAIRLQIINYKKTGAFVGTAGIDQLVETAIWNRLMPVEKDFLLRVSVFDSFTACQAASMLDYEILPVNIEAKLKASDFVRFLPDKNLFVVHSILLDYLRNQFYYHQPTEYQNRLLRKAGFSFASMGEYCSAIKFFYMVGDFNAIMSLPLTHWYLDEQRENCDEELFTAVVRDCPEEVMRKHPSAMIVFAYFARLNGQDGLYEKLCGQLRMLLQGNAELSREEIRKIKGEFILLESLGNFDLSKMREGYETVNEILRESPDIVENSIPWLSVFPTVFGMFWHESGRLDEDLRTIDEFKPTYRQFNRGQGTGLGCLIRAEILLMRGEDEEAEILCSKAHCEALANKQTSICIYAELCLARIFILRGDGENFFDMLESIQKHAKSDSDIATRRMVDLCLSIISLLLGTRDYVAPWLYDIEGIRKSVYVPVVPFVELLHIRLLLEDKRYNELYAVAQLALDTSLGPDARARQLLLHLYGFLFLAVAKHDNGEETEARRYLKEALRIALPDRIYLPFADYECLTDLIPESDMCRFMAGEEEDSIFALRSLFKRQANGISVIKKAFLQRKSPLTPREREIALLAKERRSAKEIAAQLYISEKTVKSTLGRVYDKLKIHSRSELSSVEF